MLKEIHYCIFEIDYKIFIYDNSRNAIFLLNLFNKKPEVLNSGFLVTFFLA